MQCPLCDLVLARFAGEAREEQDLDEDESEDGNEEYDSPLPPEYYEELRRKSYERHVALGIDDLPDEASRDFCETQALAKITREGIADEEARKAVYAEMKRAVFEAIENIREGAASDGTHRVVEGASDIANRSIS